MSSISNTDIKNVDDALKLEKERLDAKKKLIDNAIFSQNRQQDLNESYRKRYVYYNYIATVIVIALLIYLTLVVIQYFFPIIPNVIIDLATMLLFAFIIIFIIYNLGIIYSRDKMDFDKINTQSLNIISASELAKQRMKDVNSGNLSGISNADMANTCVGEACCSNGTRWDLGNLKCVTGTISSFATISESFGCNDCLIVNGMVKPFEPSEFDNYAKI
jgi:hypothetical protein